MSTAFINRIDALLRGMTPTNLEAMDHVKLMRRHDTKYVLSKDLLPEILISIQDDYKVLSLDDERLQPYETVYFDTPELQMYLEHHNGRMNRYKVRMRKYVLSGESYLEIKFKNNRGETIKKRVKTAMNVKELEDENQRFLSENSPFSFNEISPALWNRFRRITLVSKSRPERLTIDLGLGFSENNKSEFEQLDETCIIEVKRDLDADGSDIIDVLDRYRVKATGFSKYCFGTVLTKEVKHNLFKQRLRNLGLYDNVV